MKFGIFYEHQLPRPWTEDSEYRLIQDALDQIEYADSIGIDYAWEVEHHFLEEYSHSSAPEVFLAAASQRTKNIRLGHGIVQTPPPFNHPARIAERIAMLDLVSGGRADFGTGESSSEAELGGFMIDPEKKRAMWEEGLRVAVRCMTEEPFTGSLGRVRHDAAAQRAAEAAPEAAPAAVGRVQPARHDPPRRAEGRSARSRSRSSIPKKRSTGSTTTTRRSTNEGVPIGDAVNAERRVRHHVHVRTTTKTKRSGAASKARTSSATRSRTTTCSAGTSPRVTSVWDEFQQRRAEHGYDPEAVIAAAENQDRLGAKVVESGIGGLRGAVGTPDQIREYLQRYEECGVDQVIFCFQAGKNRHEHIMEALELFGREVLPEFKERDEKLTRDKEQRLAPVVDTVMARKPAEDHPPLPSPTTTRSRRSRARWPTASATTTSTRCSTTFAEQSRARSRRHRGPDQQPASSASRNQRRGPGSTWLPAPGRYARCNVRAARRSRAPSSSGWRATYPV